MSSLWFGLDVKRQFEARVPVFDAEYSVQKTFPQLSEAIFTNSSRTKFAKCSQTYSYLLGRVRGCGRGEAHIPLASPTPLTLPYTLQYICTVHELSLQTVGEYRLRGWGYLSNSETLASKRQNTSISKYNNEISSHTLIVECIELITPKVFWDTGGASEKKYLIIPMVSTGPSMLIDFITPSVFSAPGWVKSGINQ